LYNTKSERKNPKLQTPNATLFDKMDTRIEFLMATSIALIWHTEGLCWEYPFVLCPCYIRAGEWV